MRGTTSEGKLGRDSKRGATGAGAFRGFGFGFGVGPVRGSIRIPIVKTHTKLKKHATTVRMKRSGEETLAYKPL